MTEPAQAVARGPHHGLSADAVIGHVYWRSHFPDTNGDGIGDCRGGLRVLEHYRAMGCTAIWLAPFFESPGKDFGYDVSDFFTPDPKFGSMDDVRALTAEAHRLGMKVLFDIVPCHTSDQHPLFQQARSSRDNPYHDWYLWAEGRNGGNEPPTNAVSVFAPRTDDPAKAEGSAWTHNAQTGEWYNHTFLPEQPALNWRNPAVKKYVVDIANFWLGQGFDGFRWDAAPHGVMAQDFALRDEEMLPVIDADDDPYNWFDHTLTKNVLENGENLSAVFVGDVVSRVRETNPEAYCVAESVVFDNEELLPFQEQGVDVLDFRFATVAPDPREIAQVLRDASIGQAQAPADASV